MVKVANKRCSNCLDNLEATDDNFARTSSGNFKGICRECESRNKAAAYQLKKEEESKNKVEPITVTTIDFSFIIQNLTDKVGTGKILLETQITYEELLMLESGIFTVMMKLLDMHLEHCPEEHGSSLMFVEGE